MQTVWRLCLVLLTGLGAVAAALAAAELTGLAARGALLGPAGDGERWAALVVGALLVPFGATALRHGVFVVEPDRIGWLAFGLVCRTRWLRVADVARWGHAVGRNRGRREPLLLFATRDSLAEPGGRRHLVKLAMYAQQQRLLEVLAERLGPPTQAHATMTGVRFDDA